MKFTDLLSDDAVIFELGTRLAGLRVASELTQAQLAEEASVSKSTVERLEDGKSVQLTNVIRCLRVLGKLEDLERFIPEPGPNPIDLLKRRGTRRSRVRSSSKSGTSVSRRGGNNSPIVPTWVWDDEK
jgi:transcriptional regulator with XRE-family HTH domain